MKHRDCCDLKGPHDICDFEKKFDPNNVVLSLLLVACLAVVYVVFG